MESDKNEWKIDWTKLEKRFPDLAFLLTISSFTPISLIRQEEKKLNGQGSFGFLYSQNIAEETNKWKENLPLDRIDILYVFGVGLGYYYEAISSWLHEKKERSLVFFEHDIRVLHALFSLPLGNKILDDAKVHIVYLPDLTKKSWENAFDESVSTWVSDHVELSALVSYNKQGIGEKRVALLRKSTIVHAAIAELLHYPKLMDNIAANFLELEGAFHVNQLKGAFAGIPAVICGAGNSLFADKEALKQLEQRALIFAGGSAITALTEYGIRPHFAVAVDPNEEEYERLKEGSAFEVPFVFSSRLHKQVLPSMNAPKGYLCSDTGGVFESWLHEELQIDKGSLGPELGMEALSVTTLALPLAKFLGCTPIAFCGVDLAYKEGKRYTKGLLPSSIIALNTMKEEKRSMEKLLYRKNGEGVFVQTLVKWVMEKSCIERFIQKNKQISFFNGSKEGLRLKGANYLGLEFFAKEHCKVFYDLRGMLQASSQQSLFKKTSENVQEAFGRLTTSLEKAISLGEKMVEEILSRMSIVQDLSASLETGMMSLIEMDLEEEIAYIAALQSVFPACSKILDRCYPEALFLDTEKGRRAFLQKKHKLWTQVIEAGKKTLAIINQYRNIP